MLRRRLILSAFAPRRRSLFDGRTFAGWRAPFAEIPITECWRVRDGAIATLADSELKRNLSTDIWTAGEFGAFELRFEYFAASQANGGVKFQIDEPVFVEDIRGEQRFLPEFAQAPGAHIIAYTRGLEFQVSAPDEPVGQTKPLARAGSLYNKVAAPAEVSAKALAWNKGRIRLEPDGRLRHWLNDALTVDTHLTKPVRRSPIALQHHHTSVAYRRLQLEEIL
jgi:hypothetical protein